MGMSLEQMRELANSGVKQRRKQHDEEHQILAFAGSAFSTPNLASTYLPYQMVGGETMLRLANSKQKGW